MTIYTPWVHDTDYRPAREHIGFALPLNADGAAAVAPGEDDPQVVGWRSCGACVWQGGQFYPRAEFPSIVGEPPMQVEALESDQGAFGEWFRQAALPHTLTAATSGRGRRAGKD